MTTARKGTVYLVGAGPGDPELLTLKAAALLATADIILHDDLVPQTILDYAGPQACVVSVGKRCGMRRIAQEQIHALMIDDARRGLSVVRLKSGDPLLFGRAAEEIEALELAGIPCEVVPGVTAMFAAAAVVRKSLTDRRSASKIILTTAHHASHATERGRPSFWSGSLPNDATLGIYMPGRDLGALALEMRAAGMAEELPCLVVSRVSLPEQQVQSTVLVRLAELDPGPTPLLVLVGWSLANANEAVTSTIVSAEAVNHTMAIEP